MLPQRLHLLLQGVVPLPGEAQAFVAGRGQRRERLAHLYSNTSCDRRSAHLHRTDFRIAVGHFLQGCGSYHSQGRSTLMRWILFPLICVLLSLAPRPKPVASCT